MHDSWVAYFRTQSCRNLYRFYGRAKKSWDQFDEYDSQKLRNVMQTSEKAKVDRWIKYLSKVLISRLAKNFFKARRNVQSFFLLTCQRMVSPSAIRGKTGGKRVCRRFRREHAHVQQERPELCRIGNREGLWKSDDVCDSQWRSANKRRGDVACQRIGFIRDSNALRRYTGSSFTRNSAKITGIITIGPVVRKHISSKMAGRSLATQRTTSLHCPWSIDKFFNLTFTYFSYIIIAGSRNSHIPHHQEVRVWVRKYTETCRMDQLKSKTQTKMTTTKKYKETCRVICQNGQRVQGQFGRWKCSWTPRRFQFFSRITFRAASESGIGYAPHFHSLPEGPKSAREPR